MSLKQNIVIAILGAGLTLAGMVGASAGEWHSDRTRRMEVDHRLVSQSMQIHRDVRDGELNHHEAFRLHHAEHRIRLQQRHDARLHDGHITRREQAVLNHEENRVGNTLHRDAR